MSFDEHVSQYGELGELLKAIARTSAEVRAEMPHRLGSQNSTNKFGDSVQKLDEWTNQFLTRELFKTGLVKEIYSEEAPVAQGPENAPFVVAMDPLDGSGNVKTNNPCGTIYSIYRDRITTGKDQVAALYKLYGPVTTLVYSCGRGVHEFVKTRKGEPKFEVTRENIMLPEPGKVYGIGGKKSERNARLAAMLDSLEGRNMKTRYCGALVADFNQVLHNGGLFAYTSSKLRLNYEARPVAFIAEQAGGTSSDGKQSLLETTGDADSITPVYFGNKTLIREIEECYKEG